MGSRTGVTRKAFGSLPFVVSGQLERRLYIQSLARSASVHVATLIEA